jgi:hypothetical protein
MGVFVMIPNVPQPASLVESPAPVHQRSFAFQQILAYYRGDLADPQACAAVEEQVRRDRRWQAHWESLRYLDLDRAAALQDAKDLTHFDAARETPFCKVVAEYGTRIFDTLISGADGTAGCSRHEWNNHVDQCPYCRRMRRLAHARQQQREAGLPAGEPLLRDWLLQPCYIQALREATLRLGFEWRPDVPEAHDTIVSEDTVLRDPPRTGT